MDERTFYNQSAAGIANYLWQEMRLRPGQNYQVRQLLDGPRCGAITLAINATYARRVMAMSDQLSMAAGLSRNSTIRIRRGDGSTLILEIPKPEPFWYNVPIMALPRHRGVRTTLGLDTDHRPALVDFSNPVTAHILIAGATGSGKTNAGRLLAYDLASQNEPGELNLLLIDTRKYGAAWREMSRLPHLAHPIIIDEVEAIRALGWAVAELDRRARQGYQKPLLFIGIDEAQALLESEQFTSPIVTLAGVGREFGIHLALLTQNPTAAMLGDNTIKRNLTARLVGRVDSSEAARVATGQGGSGAELLTGSGDMLLVQPGEIRRLMAALVTERDMARLPRVESIRVLDFSEYEDVDHVVDQANLPGGRNPDPLNPDHVAYALTHPDASQREINREFGIGFVKIRRVLEFASALNQAIESYGYAVQRATDRNEVRQLPA